MSIIDTLAANDTEEGHQTALFAWAAMQKHQYPELLWLHHIPNGGSRGDGKQAMIRGAKLKAQGVRPGVADVFLPVKRGAFSGLYIELKKPSLRPKLKTRWVRGGLSDEQIAFCSFVREQGFGWTVCYSWNEAAKIILEYLNWKGD